MAAHSTPLALPITLFYCGLLSIWFLFLAFSVMGLRRKKQVGLGTKQDPQLLRMVRIHGNFNEYIPLGLIMMGFFEISGLSSHWIHAMGITFFLGRVLHYIGLAKSAGATPERFIGMLITFFCLISQSLTAIVRFIF